MPERSADSKESVNLHDDDVNATIGEGEESKEVVKYKGMQHVELDDDVTFSTGNPITWLRTENLISI